MDSHFGDPAGFKRSTRVPLEAVVRLHFEGTVAYQNGFAANASATGMFVKYPDPPPVGTKLVFEFTVGHRRKPVQGAGEVVWVRERYEGPGKPAGIGIEFTQLDAQSRDHIAEALFEFLELSLGHEMLDLPQAEVDRPVAAAPEPARPSPPFAASGAPASGFDFAPAPRADDEPPTWSLADQQEAANEAPTEDPDATLLAWESPPPPEPRDTPPPTLASPFAAAAAGHRGGLSSSFWIVLGVVAVLGGVAWGLWRYYLGPSVVTEPVMATETAPARPKRAPLPPATDPTTTLASTVGATEAPPDAVRPAAETPAATVPERRTEDEAASEALREEASAGSAEAATPPIRDAGAEPRESPPPAASEPERSPAATPASVSPAPIAAQELVDLEWTEAMGTTVLTLTADAPLREGSVSYSEIGGEKPRLLVKIRGLSKPFRAGNRRIDTAAVAGARTGFHATAAGTEVHVVLDLARPGVALDGFEVVGSRIVAKLTAR